MLARAASLRLLAGQYNLLCPAYGVKWSEREACKDWGGKDDHGGSNWDVRWPALRRIIASAPWDVLALEELQTGDTRDDVVTALGDIGMRLIWFDHPGREDALGIAYKTATLSPIGQASRPFPAEDPKATTGRVDLQHSPSGQVVRVLVTHQRGGVAAQLDDLFDFASADAPAGCVTLVCGDFNEDFGEAALRIRPGYRTLPRGGDEPVVSRPVHKQGAENSSGKGKIDYIFVKAPEPSSSLPPDALTLERDAESRQAILHSHAACQETGEWPSDHGLEALSLTLKTPGTAQGSNKASAESSSAAKPSKATATPTSAAAGASLSQFWLLKSEPDDYSIEQLETDGSTVWDGVRNPVARKNLNAMRVGDRCLFYHSSCGKKVGVVGECTVSRAAYPDPADAKWCVVDVEFGERYRALLTLERLKAESDGALSGLALFKQSRLSVVPVSAAHHATIVALAEDAARADTGGETGAKRRKIV